jgi:hypothetical protein
MHVILLLGTASQPGGAFLSTPFTGAVTLTSGGGGSGALRWRLGLGVGDEGGGGLGGLGGAVLRVCGWLLARLRVVGGIWRGGALAGDTAGTYFCAPDVLVLDLGDDRHRDARELGHSHYFRLSFGLWTWAWVLGLFLSAYFLWRGQGERRGERRGGGGVSGQQRGGAGGGVRRRQKKKAAHFCDYVPLCRLCGGRTRGLAHGVCRVCR